MNSKSIAASLAALLCWSSQTDAQYHRDFVRQDDEGHLILRYVGPDAAALQPDQAEAVTHAFVSVMVHDKLQADISFELEPADLRWATSNVDYLQQHLQENADGLNTLKIACRSATCRIVYAHPAAWRVAEHQALMGSVQRRIEALIAGQPNRFERNFSMAGYHQEQQAPRISVYLKRRAP